MRYLSAIPFLPILASAIAIPAPFPEAEAVSPAGVKIEQIVYAGSGCNQGTLDINVAADGSICPIRTRDLWAADGAGSDYDDHRRFCQLNFVLTYPQGWSFTVFGVDYKGYVSLGSGSTGLVRSSYYFSGETDQVVSTIDFTGPTSGRFEKHDAIAWGTWSPCGTTDVMLNVKQEVLVSGSGKIASTSTDGEFGNIVFLKWKKC
ncbi:hypothetical protein FQN50_003572 [Emmonsiellopsis sp. PD_5]|nr:hypothetical protein FQN50_003572 [Emmonsiellopsis sp. PD_5]